MEVLVPNKLTILMLAMSILLSACGASGAGAVDAVEGYINALDAKDEARLISLSCAAWETDAMIELDSLELVATTLEGFSCQQSGTDGDTALVDCEGKLIMSYQNEDQELDLSTRTYEVIQQGGDWLVCGVR
jgi:hypothetical protein